MLNAIIGYFDLQSRRRGEPIGVKGAAPITVVPQYIAASLGIIAEPYLSKYAESGKFEFSFENFLPGAIFGLLVGLTILPAVYRAAFDEKSPYLVQFATLFVSGLGWQSLFTTAVKVVDGTS